MAPKSQSSATRPAGDLAQASPNQPDLHRREFLKRTFTGALTLSSAALLARCTNRESGPAAGLLVLNVRELKTLQNLCEVILPAGAEARSAATSPSTDPLLATPYRVDQELSHWTPKNQADMKSVLALVEDGTRYFLFSWRHFSELTVGERRQYLDDWSGSEFRLRRTAYQAVRMICFFFYYSQDSTWKAIGYDGPWVRKD